MIAYKLVRRRKDGSLGPLFIDARLRIPFGEWLPARHDIDKKGFAYRPGWHCTFDMNAPHLSEKDRVWVRCEIEDYETYARPESQGGSWLLAQRIKFLEVMA